jgi:hypothetical protein
MASQKRSSGGRGGAPGCLFWLLLLCVVLLLFLVNLGKIKETLSRTNFNEILQTQKNAEDRKTPPVTPAPVVQPEPGSSPAPSPEPAATKPGKGSSPSASTVLPPEDAATDGSPDATQPAAKLPAAKPGTQSGSGAATTSGTTAGSGGTAGAKQGSGATGSGSTAPAAPAKKRTALLYFVRIDDDGIIVRQEVTRQIPASDQPLTDALSALLGGPSEEELRRHLLSLVPQGTKLLSVQVRGSTAFLNFNEAFMYNHYGIEGYAGQLKQVVYTATAFSSVQDVQILIEGERHDYLGGEGVYIGKPLSRNSF